MITVGQAARSARKALGLTQDDASERIGISAEFYARIERGHHLPSVLTLYWMTIALGVDASRLLGLSSGSSDDSDDSDDSEPGPSSNSGPAGAKNSDELDPLPVRRLVRRLRKASPAALRSVSRLLEDLEGPAENR